jgi:hypothetical protein
VHQFFPGRAADFAAATLIPSGKIDQMIGRNPAV